MSIIVKYYPCIFEDKCYEFKTRNKSIATVFLSLVRKYPEIGQDSGNISIRVNGKLISPFKWHCTELNDGDQVFIIQEMGFMLIPIILGALFTIAPSTMATITTICTILTVVTTVASLAYSIYSMCTAKGPPKTGQGLGTGATYGWQGLQLQKAQAIPVPVVYGEHLIGGDLIECFVTTDGEKNYLNMLIGLCEGEIEGICKEDLINDPGVCTTAGQIMGYVSNPTRNIVGATIFYTLEPLAIDNPTTGTLRVKWIDSQGVIQYDVYTYTGVNGFDGQIYGMPPTGRGTFTGLSPALARTYDSNARAVVGNIDIPYILVNNNPVSNFRDVQYDFRTGTQDQAIIPGFSNIYDAYDIGAQITYSAYEYTTTGTDVQFFELMLRTPALYIEYKGNYYPTTASADVYYKVHGAPTWIKAGTQTIWGSSQNPLRRYFRKDGLAPNQYDIRVIMTAGHSENPMVQDNLWLDTINEGNYDTLQYPHTALLSLKILASEQLSGNPPNVLTRIRGRKVLNLDTEAIEWSRNPIYCFNDLLVTPRFGAGNYITQAAIDNDQLVEQADYCDEIVGDGTSNVYNSATATSLTDSDYYFTANDVGKYISVKSPVDPTFFTNLLITSITSDHTANGTGGWSYGTPVDLNWEYGEKRFSLDLCMDTQDQALTILQQFCGSFRGSPLWLRDAIQVIMDKPTNPSYLFNMGNIVEGSFKHGFSSEKEKPTSVSIQYADQDQKYQRVEVEVDDKEAFVASNLLRNRQLQLFGATRQSQAYREGRFHLRAANYQDEIVSFKAGIDATPVLPGAVVNVQHDVPQWGYGGRVAAGSTISTIVLDKAVTIVSGTYVVQVTLPGTNGAENLVVGTVTDSTPGDYTTLHITPNWPSVPPVGAMYVFGALASYVKPFRIAKILRTPNNELEISGVNYDTNVYIDTDVTLAEPQQSDLPNSIAIADVTNLAAVEKGNTLGDGSWVEGIELSFQLPSNAQLMAWDHGEVWISSSNPSVSAPTAWEFYGQTSQSWGYKIENSLLLQTGDTVSVRVVSVSKSGIKTSFESAPYVDVTLTGKPVAPANVTGFAVAQVGDHLNFTWSAVADTDVDHYEIREGASWAAGSEIAYKAYGLSFQLFDFTSGSKTYRIKAINRSGISSVTDATANITAVGVDTGTTPSGLSANSTFKYIILTWTNASSVNVEYTEIWRSDTNNRAAATMIGTAMGTIYWDLIGSTGITKYYWIRTKILNGGNGPWLPSSATGGVTATTAQLQTNDYADLSITNAKIGLLAVDTAQIADEAVETAKIGLLQVTSAQIANLTVAGVNVAYFMASRGVQNIVPGGLTLTDTTEKTLATITPITFETADSVWLWASSQITTSGVNSGKSSSVPLHFRIRRDYASELRNALLHFNGSNNSTTITDEYQNVWVADGVDALTTTGPKWGSACLISAAGGGNHVHTTAFTSLGNKFTLECWWKPSDVTSTNSPLIRAFNAGNYGIDLIYNNDGSKKFRLAVSSNGTSWNVANYVAGSYASWSNGTWYKIIIDYDGANYRVYRGTSGALTADITVASAAVPCAITNIYVGWGIVGSVDEFRATLETYRYGSSATAETGAFSKDANVELYGCYVTYGSAAYTYGEIFPPVVLFGTDVPGPPIGGHTYTLTVQPAVAPDSTNAVVAYRILMGQAKSR